MNGAVEFRMGTWNVRSLLEAGKLHNAVKEMKRLNLDILGISEHRWPGTGSCSCGDARMYYSGPSKSGRNGVAIIVRNGFKEAVENVTAYSDRVMLMQIKGKTQKINIVQAYAPTADKEDVEIEDFYNQLQEVIKPLKKHDMNVVMGDLNAKVGSEEVPGVTGAFGLGNRNERGEALIQFCKENEFVVKNTYYKMSPRRLYTWRSPQDTVNNPVRNQIDYILINKRFQNSITRTAAYPGADIGSDHNPVIANCLVKFKTTRKKKINKKIDIEKLRDDKLIQKLKSKCSGLIKTEEIEANGIEAAWSNIKNGAMKAAQETLGKTERRKCKPWMTDEILDLMEDRRLAKIGGDNTKYKEIQRNVRRKVKEAKLNWVTEQCEEAEELIKIHDSFNFHKKIKEITGTYRRSGIMPTLRKGDGSVILEQEDIKTTWKEYAENLFIDTRSDPPDADAVEMTGPPILESEVEYALKRMKNRKAPGADELPAELLKCIDVKVLTKLFNKIYNSGSIPSEWLMSTFVPIPKKPNAKTCTDFRLISLMSHALKTLLRILHMRICKKCEAVSGDTQFGFRQGLGTREALFAMKILMQQCYDHQQEIFICFLDYEKAFDTVQHEPLVQILRQTGLDDKDIRIIQNLYWHQEAEVRVGGDQKTESFRVMRGVRQGCVLSPLLFNMYLEKVFSIAMEGEEIGIPVNGKRISNLRYADDSAIITESMADMQRIVEKISNTGQEYGVRINVGKTKLMFVGRGQAALNDNLIINQETVEKVTRFKYLGSTINAELDDDEEIKIRCGIARTTFRKMEKALLHRSFPLDIRLRVVKCYIWSVLLYGVETWSLKVRSMNRLEAFEMWTLRRMLRIPWTDRISNAEVLERAETDRELLRNVKRRKTGYLGHFLRGDKYEILRLLLCGRIDGKRPRGRKKLSWLRNIRQWSGVMDIGEIFRRARENKLKIE